MPANVVKTAADEKHWEKAKEIVATEYKMSPSTHGARYWKLVMGVFKKMKGGDLEEITYSSSVGTFALPVGNLRRRRKGWLGMSSVAHHKAKCAGVVPL